MTTPDVGPNDLLRVLKSLTRSELEAYAMINALTVETLANKTDNRDYLNLVHIPHGTNPKEDEILIQALDLGSEVSKKVQEEISKSSVRKN